MHINITSGFDALIRYLDSYLFPTFNAKCILNLIINIIIFWKFTFKYFKLTFNTI